MKSASSEDERYDHFLSFVVSYCRPFTENSGLGNLRVEFPNYPKELELEEADLRHQRMMDMRNKFLSHSSLEGTKVVLLAPGSTDPGTGIRVSDYSWNIAKREFLNEQFAEWLVAIVDALNLRLDKMINDLVQELGRKYLDAGEIHEIETPTDAFKWTEPNNGQQGAAPNP